MLEETRQRIAPLGYVPALDGVRALAVASVLLFHSDAGFASGGFLGVSVFFTISGFLVASLLLDEHANTDTIDLTSFVTRRARRLVPAAWACLAVVVVFLPFWNSGQLERLGGDIVAAVANVSNWRAATSETSYQDLFDSSPSPLAHFWSLAIEMQFYIALPIVAAVTLRTGGRRRFVLVVLALLAASVASSRLTRDFDLAYNGTHTRAAELLLGVLLAVAMFRARQRGWSPSPRSNTVIGACAVLGLTVLVVTASTSSIWLLQGGLVGVASLSCALIVATLGAGPVATLLAHPVLVSIGKLSYGIYLFHWPLFLVVSPERTGLDGVALFVVRCSITAVITVASYRLLETPIRRHQLLVEPRTTRRLALVSAATFLAVAAVLPTAEQDATAELLASGTDGLVRFDDVSEPTVAGAPPRPAVAEVRSPSLDADRDGGIEFIDTPVDTIAPPPPLRVLVVGSDVAALDVISGLASTQTGRVIEVIDAVRPDCPLADVVEVSLEDRVVDVSGCDTTAATVGRALARSGQPDLVVVAAGELDSGIVRRAADAGFPTDADLDDVAARSGVTRQAIDELVAPFDDAGVPTLMSWWGGAGLLDLELGRVDATRTSVVGFARDADTLRDRVRSEAAFDGPGRPDTRVLVLGDSTSLVLARALHDAGDRLDVLWAGDNGCPIVRATSIHAGTDRPSRPLACPDFSVKLPAIVDDFEPDVVIVMPGTIALTNLTFVGDERPQIPGTPSWIEYHDAEFTELLDVLRPFGPDRTNASPAVLIADTPAIKRGPFSTPEMITPERLAAVNAQIERWASNHADVDLLDYAGPLERYETEFGSIRPDDVHPAAIELTEIAAASYIDPVIAAAHRHDGA